MRKARKRGRIIAAAALAAVVALTGTRGEVLASGASRVSPDAVSAVPGWNAGGSVSTDFSDIRGSYAEGAVKRLAEAGYLRGVEPGRFAPRQPVSRQDIAVLLGKVAGYQPATPQWPRFQDVNIASPQAPYVYALNDAGILKGRADGYADAAAPLTRQDLAVLLSRLMTEMGLAPGESGSSPAQEFVDDAQIAGYAREAVYAVAAKGWMVGHNGRFAPTGLVTRADAALVAERVLAARKSQTESVAVSFGREQIAAAAGEEVRLDVQGTSGAPLPFTPVFAFDRPEIGTVRPDGTFVAGPGTGSGTLTASVGYKTVTVPVEVTPGGTRPEGTEAEPDGTKPSSDGAGRDSDGSGLSAGSSAPAEPAGRDVSAPPSSTDRTPVAPGVNVAPDSRIQVTPTGPSDPAFRAMEKTYPGPAGGLAASSETWTGFYRQIGREVMVELPSLRALQEVRMTFRQDRKAGILLPDFLEVEVSRDGRLWFYAGKALHGVSPSDETPIVRTLSVALPSVEARYIRVRFPVKVWVFARQLQVLAAPSAPAVTGRPVLLAPARQTSPLADVKAGDRVHDLLLAYSGAYGERGSWKKEDFLPLVGYMTQDGAVMDRMFDSVLFLPYPTMPATKEAWEDYLHDLFVRGRQLDALNEAMREFNKRRGTLYTLPTVENVILALPYPNPAQSDFGKVLEDQVSLSFSPERVGEERAYRYRLEALQWYLDEVEKRWKNADFQYLRLEGIYWFHELIDDGAPRERQLVQSAAAMVHERALRFYWIPYIGAPGLPDWRELGFDYAFVQPNYYGDKDTPVERIEVTLALANQYGMGIEVEGDERMVRDFHFYRLYYNQLIAGHRLGIDKDKVHAYYYGSKSLLEAFHSKDEQARAVYDDTYRWMKGRFTMTEYLTPEMVSGEDGSMAPSPPQLPYRESPPPAR